MFWHLGESNQAIAWINWPRFLFANVILKRCLGVREVPREFRNLKKLLTELQTLQGFIVGKDDGRGIRELKNMNEISGSFCITWLENVSSAEEAKEASLADKKLIDKL